MVEKPAQQPAKGSKFGVAWVKGPLRPAVEAFVGPYVLPYEASESCCISLKSQAGGLRFVSARLGPMLLNDTIAKTGSVKVVGEWYDEALEWVITNMPLRKMASESPIGLVGCRFKFWAQARISRRWIGRLLPVTVPTMPQVMRAGHLELVVELERGVAVEEAISRGVHVINAQADAVAVHSSIEAIGAEVLRRVMDRQWGIAAAMLHELRLATDAQRQLAMSKADSTKRTALRYCVDGQWEERPTPLLALEGGIVTVLLGTKRPYLWTLHITAVCDRTLSFLGETRIGMPRSQAASWMEAFRPWSAPAAIPPWGDCQWSEPERCQGQLEVDGKSEAEIARLLLATERGPGDARCLATATDLVLRLVEPGEAVCFGAASFRNPLALAMLAVEGRIVGTCATGIYDLPTCARFAAELQECGPREIAASALACGANPRALADDSLSPYTSALLTEDPCGLVDGVSPKLRARIQRNDALAWAEIGRSSCGAGHVDLVATPLAKGLPVPDDLAEGLLDFCFRSNLPLLAVRVLVRIDGEQHLLPALELAEDPQWFRVAERILGQSFAGTPLWCSAGVLSYALEQIRKGRHQFRLLLNAFLGRIHGSELDFYECPASLACGGAECPICFEVLYRNTPMAFVDTNGNAICQHFLCSGCSRSYQAAASSTSGALRCPECRRQSAKFAIIPPMSEDPLAWFDFLSMGKGAVTHTMLVRAVATMLPVDADSVGAFLGEFFFTSSNSMGQEVSAAEFLASGLYAWIRRHEDEHRRCATRGPLPKIAADREEWFRYWNFSRSGVLCRGEILRAMLRTFEVSSLDCRRVDSLKRRLDRLWDRCTSDRKERHGHCSTEGVSYAEFMEEDGLGDLLEEALDMPLVKEATLDSEHRRSRPSITSRPSFDSVGGGGSVGCVSPLLVPDSTPDEDLAAIEALHGEVASAHAASSARVAAARDRDMLLNRARAEAVASLRHGVAPARPDEALSSPSDSLSENGSDAETWNMPDAVVDVERDAVRVGARVTSGQPQQPDGAEDADASLAMLSAVLVTVPPSAPEASLHDDREGEPLFDTGTGSWTGPDYLMPQPPLNQPSVPSGTAAAHSARNLGQWAWATRRSERPPISSDSVPGRCSTSASCSSSSSSPYSSSSPSVAFGTAAPTGATNPSAFATPEPAVAEARQPASAAAMERIMPPWIVSI